MKARLAEGVICLRPSLDKVAVAAQVAVPAVLTARDVFSPVNLLLLLLQRQDLRLIETLEVHNVVHQLRQNAFGDIKSLVWFAFLKAVCLSINRNGSIALEE